MRKLTILLVSLLAGISTSLACTSIIVGKNASADGSVFCTYNCDSFGMFRSIRYAPAGTHEPGEMIKIYDNDDNVYHGEIPQVPVTYNVVGHINEYQVAISETTFGGRPEMVDPEGAIDYGNLMYLALERSKTAREAIDVMTTLAETYGYCSTGESFSICDPNEAWIMEMVGGGKGSKTAHWVAMRVPDDAICCHANQSRIRKFDSKDKKNVICSKNVIKYARDNGWFSGDDKDFSFADTFDEPDFNGRRFCDARVWSVYRRFASDFDRYLPYVEGKLPLDQTEPMPLWIVPNRKVSLTDVQECLRDHYEGTALAMDDDPGMGLFEAPYRAPSISMTINGEAYFAERPISSQQSAFVWISQSRSWLPRQVGGVIWWANDDGNMAAFTPLYCCNTSVPRCYKTPGASAAKFSSDNAYWVCNMVSNMVYPRYNLIFPDLKLMRDSLDNQYQTRQPAIEQTAVALCQTNPDAAVTFLTDYSNSTAQHMLDTWKELAEYIIVKYNDYAIKQEESRGVFKFKPGGIRPVVKRMSYSKRIGDMFIEQTGDRFKKP